MASLAVDAMCRASTGDGDVRRKLYTDGDFAVFSFKRCILFDGIDVGALAPDLAERAVPIVLDLIPDEKRKLEKAFWRDWPSAHPKLLGALLELAVTVLANPVPAEASARRTHAKLLRRSISPPSQPEKSGGDSAPSAFAGGGETSAESASAIRSALVACCARRASATSAARVRRLAAIPASMP
jgi:hypothetical protein